MPDEPSPVPANGAAETSSPPPINEGDAQIEIDAASDAGDSAIDDQISTFTASLSSSVIDYPIEHGRRYHAFRSGTYPMPNDERELDRLDFTHAIMVKGIGERLYFAPIAAEKTHRIMDVGTGTGIWAIDIGDIFPNAEVIGNDLSPIQPSWVPPNVKFEVDDVESPWQHNHPFDYIFCRYMVGCIADWPKLFGNIYDNLSPGGWAEFQDYKMQYYSEDGSLAESTDTLKWITLLLDASKAVGREPNPGPLLEGWAKDAGFKNVTHHKFKFPIGPWPKEPKLKELGMYNLVQVLNGLEGFSLRLFCDVLGWSEPEVHVLLAKVRKELKSNELHILIDFHVVYGQKVVE